MNRPAHAHRLGDLAERFGLKLLGDRDTTIRGVATLAGPEPVIWASLPTRAIAHSLPPPRQAL